MSFILHPASPNFFAQFCAFVQQFSLMLNSLSFAGTIKVMEKSSTDIEEFPELLRAVGLRVTKPRLAVLEELITNPHSTPEMVRHGVSERIGSVSTQAIYDVLHVLTEKKLLRVISPTGSLQRYEVARHDNHHHLVCRTCSTIVNIPCVVGSAPCLEPSETHDYLIDEAEVIFWGYCPNCQEQQ